VRRVVAFGFGDLDVLIEGVIEELAAHIGTTNAKKDRRCRDGAVLRRQLARLSRTVVGAR
jgi:hypothetical protein